MNAQILEAKKAVVDEIVAKAKNSQTIIICEYRGLTVAKTQEIRRALRKEGCEMNVYKNSLVERAFEQLGYDAKSYLEGPNAIVFSEDVINGAKIIAKYSKKLKDILTIKGGVIEGKVCDDATVKEIAKLPGKEGLISMFLSCLQAPVRSFACAIQAVADAK